MQLCRAAANQDLEKLDDGGLAGVPSLVGHPEEFRRCFGGDTAADVLEDLLSFRLSANGREVPRGVRQEADAEDQHDGWDALEGEQEAPADGGETVVDEGEPEGDPVRDGDSDCGKVKVISTKQDECLNPSDAR